jgi:hypothetical protein
MIPIPVKKIFFVVLVLLRVRALLKKYAVICGLNDLFGGLQR